MFNLFKKKDSRLNAEAIEISANLILCFNSYLLEHYETILTPQEMDAVTESTLMYKGIETDQLKFMLYCSATMNAVTQIIRSNKNSGAALRTQIDFDASFKKYCNDLRFTRLIEIIRITEKEKIFSVHFNAANNRYELNNTESTARIGYRVLFTGPETDCRNLISYGIAGVSLDKNPVLIAKDL